MSFKNALPYLRLIAISIGGAVMGGAVMAILNLLVELLKSNSVFRFADLFSITLFHMLTWSIWGAIAGITWVMYSFLRRKETRLSPVNTFLYYTFISAWLIFISYINTTILPLAFSKISLAWNATLFAAGLLFFWALIKYLGKRDSTKVPLFLKLCIGFLVIMNVSSALMNGGISREEKTIAPIKKVQDAPNNLNVIIILLDAVRYDHLSCCGYPGQTSPHIDEIAARGTMFVNAFSQSSRTNESVPSLFTSTYSCSHNVNTFSKALPMDILPLPLLFKSNGYKTAIFSTNPNVTPIRGYHRGVDDFFGVQTNINNQTLLYYILTKTAGLRIPLLGWGAKQVLLFSGSLGQDDMTIKANDPDHVTQKVTAWIEDNKENPFFIYIHYPGAHADYTPPAPYDKIFDPGFTAEPINRYPQELGMFLPFVNGKPMKPRELKNMIAQYDGEILYHDEQLGRLFKYLKEAKIDTKTLLVITADHGEEFYEHKGWGHGHSLFDELIHVPLIFYCPGLIPADKKITGLAGVVDIFPTITSLCGLHDRCKFSYPLDGVDQSAAILSGNSDKKREFIFAEVSHGGGSHWAKCLRSKNYKAIITKFGDHTQKSFFNLETDPREQNNIFADGMPVGEKYFRMIEDTVKGSYKFKAGVKTLDEMTKNRLRSLGYIK